ncbi:imidazoleglycerol-phosphate dehydratase HisB [Thermodesulfobacteriota bacterium]
MERISEKDRKTNETDIRVQLEIDGKGKHEISTGIPFFDHMLSLFTVHGFFDLNINARGDIEVDYHHTIEDVGLVLGDAFDAALGDRSGLKRYGHAVTPMDDALAAVSVDLSKRPFLVYNLPQQIQPDGNSFSGLSNEFFRAFSNRGGMNLHVNVYYGENEHHILESVFKAAGRALDQATAFDDRVTGVRSTKGVL